MRFSKSKVRALSVTGAAIAAASLVAVSAASASAVQPRGNNPKPYVNGSLRCNHMSGGIRYSPALSAANVGKTITVTFLVGSKSCAALSTLQHTVKPVNITFKWRTTGTIQGTQPKETAASTGSPVTPMGWALTGSPTFGGLAGLVPTGFSFTNVAVLPSVQGHLALRYPGRNGYPSVTGDFTGTDDGFTSSAFLTLGMGQKELKAMYNGPGITHIVITGGNLTLQ